MDADMTEHDPFERELRAGLAAERAPDGLQRRVAQIPLLHPRGARLTLWQRLAARWSAETTSWATGFAAAAASLVIGLWLGAAGIATDETSDTQDVFASVVYNDLPTSLGEEL
jgi:dipeptide/tripeptide permease